MFIVVTFLVALFIHKSCSIYPTAESANTINPILHASTAFTINGTVYVHGGSMIASNSNQLFSISFDEYGLLHYEIINEQGPAVSYHQAIILPGNDSFIVFGGLRYDFLDVSDAVEPIFAEVYSFSQNKWSILPGLNQTAVPSDRQQHCAVMASNGLIYIHGGVVPGPGNSKILMDSWVYNPLTQAFTNLSTPPIGLYDSSAIALSDGRILYVGGLTSKDSDYNYPFYLNRSMIYYTDNDTWIEQELKTQAIHVIDHYNISRKDASAVLGPEGRYIYYFGGTNGFSGYDFELYYNDILVLDTQSWTWVAPDISGIKPTHRSESIGARINNEYVLFGFGANSAYVYSEANFLRLPEVKKDTISDAEDELDFESLKWVYNITTGKTYYEQYPTVIPSGINKSAVIAITVVCGLVILSG
ncbi:hypothetical protein BDA99DRAFT_493774 [Phascolomyces articulosus]|uniref:Attractin/MKLN-like beta-propeller domain-containing protein n=1 Tax=Phascolomyces articulosus TaxID=60185 RepID=A0AAD5PJD2_9FUNG|nr:hypothetical protein BDA99DRAFT_493774 [Phascolomyces articulosus]